MSYRSSTRTIRLKYAGECACCGARIAAGEMASYNGAKRTITHEGGIKGACFSILNEKANGGYVRDPGEDAADRWNEQYS